MTAAATITIIFITLCLISGQVLCFKVIGCSGGSVMFKCMNSNQRESNDQLKGKYFCRNRDCKPGISTELLRRWVYNERYTLYDDGNSRFFTVFIRNLSREDDGRYTCGNNQKWSRDVDLRVNKNSSSCGTSVIRSAYIGQTITFSCEYEHGFKTHTKVLYRVHGDAVLVLNSSQSSQSSEEKFILSDGQKDHFTVTIRNISAADDGVYLCGVERDRADKPPSKKSNTHITFIKEIELKVLRQITSVQVEAYISKSVFITCEFPEEFKENKKFIEKDSSQKISVDEQNQWIPHDKVHVFDDTSAGVLKVFISDLTAADEATYRCGVNIADDHLFTEIKLKISQGDNFRESSESVAVIGESVKLSCNYPEKQAAHQTHL
ncbi:polymeric immunoglobulin receptor-like [Cyprinus carpio]|uniref:polymeric immunoglobulin receptor-like n=1 Tax=Cyprinus carpio TaxID=7962 RepID=UPI001C577F1E|nr:polymeric immunoglobulin receptor-like [Cyprinus carpio]